MIWLYLVLAWLAFAVVGGLVLYVSYGFVMSAIADRTKARAAGVEFGLVEKVDAVIAAPFVLLDGLLNVLVMPVVCRDRRLKGWFRMVTYRGLTFPFFELVTARLIGYHEDPDERTFRKQIAGIGVLFLDRKDPKGWHVARPKPEAQ
jgi:hypothetical protein